MASIIIKAANRLTFYHFHFVILIRPINFLNFQFINFSINLIQFIILVPILITDHKF